MKLFLSIFVLTLTLITSPAYAVVEMYNVELLCPVDSFDFTGVTTQFDALTLCEVSGTIINPDVVSNSYQSDALPGIVLQIIENPDETPQTSLSDQLDSIFDTQRQSVLAELQDFLRKNYSLKNSLVDVETELGQLIKILKEKIALLKSKISEGLKRPKNFQSKYLYFNSINGIVNCRDKASANCASLINLFLTRISPKKFAEFISC